MQRLIMRSRQLLRVIPSVSKLARGIKTNYPAGLMAPIKVGDSLPNVDLFEGAPDNVVNTGKAFGQGTHIIFAIFGAYTGTCQNHVPTFVKNYDQLKAKGVDSINCVSVNDPFVMQAFGQSMGVGDKVRCLADTQGKFTEAIDMELDGTAIVGNKRSKRYIMVVKDGKVSKLQVEDDVAQVTCTAGTDALQILEN